MKAKAISAMAAALVLGLIGPAVAEEWTGLHLTFGLSGSSTDLQTVSDAGNTGQPGDSIAPYVAAGYDWAYGDLTLGLMGDVDFGGVEQVDLVSAGKGLYGETDWFATLRARAGMPVGDNMHLYASGGVALMKTGATGKDIDSVVTKGSSQTLKGAVIGLGAEYLLAPGRHLSFEYLYADFEQSDVYLQSSPNQGTFDPTVSAFRVGYTFRF